MKPYLLLFVLFAPALCNAQAGDLKLGLNFGPSLASLPKNYSFPGLEYKMLKSYTAGAGIQYSLSKHLSLRSGISYHRKGNYIRVITDARNINGDSASFFEMYYTYHYLSIPILAQVSYGKTVKYSAFAGVFAAHLIQVTSKTFIEDHGVYKGKGVGYLRRGDFGIQSGIGISVPFNEKFSGGVELSNSLGLFDIRPESPPRNDVLRTSITTLTASINYTL